MVCQKNRHNRLVTVKTDGKSFFRLYVLLAENYQQNELKNYQSEGDIGYEYIYPCSQSSMGVANLHDYQYNEHHDKGIFSPTENGQY